MNTKISKDTIHNLNIKKKGKIYTRNKTRVLNKVGLNDECEQTDRQTDRQTYRSTDRKTNRQTLGFIGTIVVHIFFVQFSFDEKKFFLLRS